MGSAGLIFSKLVNIVSLEQFHHKSMAMYVSDGIAPVTQDLKVWKRLASQTPNGGLNCIIVISGSYSFTLGKVTTNITLTIPDTVMYGTNVTVLVKGYMRKYLLVWSI